MSLGKGTRTNAKRAANSPKEKANRIASDTLSSSLEEEKRKTSHEEQTRKKDDPKVVNRKNSGE